MANLFVNGEDLAKQKDVDNIKSLVNDIKFFPKIIGNLNSNDDLNKITTRGIYLIGGTTPQNSTGTKWTILMNIPFDNETIFQYILGSDVVIQYRKVWPNRGYGSNWITIATKSDIQNLQEQIDDLKSKIGGG